MGNAIRLFTIAVALFTLAGRAGAQAPTYSLEAVEVNDAPLAGSPRAEVTVAPGDIITAKFYIRDWSPNGEKLRSFQMTLDPAGFTGGQSGNVQPVAYLTETDNDANAFIDETDTRFVHKGLHTIPAVETNAVNYRWMSVLFAHEESIVSPQDGTKYSCGTVRFQVSDDAAGTFKISAFNDRDLTMMLNPENERIEPMAIEALTVSISAPSQWLRIQSSTPRSGAIDARLLPAKESACRWNSIRLSSYGDASSLAPGDFEVTDGTNRPPTIQKIESDPESAGTAIVHLSRGIAKGRWTKIIHKPSQSVVKIGCLPGDVTNDGALDGRDVMTLIEVLNGRKELPLNQTDLNADNATTAQDLVRLVDAVAANPASETRIAASND